MSPELTTVMQSCADGSLAGTLNFPQIVGQLMAIGVERYHADYSRQEITYYMPTGDSLVVPILHPPHETGDAFDTAAIASAVRQSQAGEHTYLDFIRKTMTAGCVGYFVLLTGRRVDYLGRRGETHTEYFPQ